MRFDDDELAFADGVGDLAERSLAAAGRTWATARTAIGIDKDHSADGDALADLDAGNIDDTATEVAEQRLTALAVFLAGAAGEAAQVADRLAGVGAVGVDPTLATAAFSQASADAGGDAFLVFVLARLVGSLGSGQDIARDADRAVADRTIADRTLDRACAG